MRAWTPARFAVPLPEGHRFPMAKYAMIAEGVVARGIVPRERLAEPSRASREAVTRVHDAGYVDAVLEHGLTEAEQRRLGFPWRPELAERSLRTVQGTIEATRDALACGIGLNLAGGTHHAFPGHGEGFCVFNDVAIAIRTLQSEGRITRAVVVDLDVHQGNGTARIFADDPGVFTFSMHGAGNYPFRKERSRLDLELPDRTGDDAYLALLSRHLDAVLEEARADLALFIAGADPYRFDRLGRLSLSMEGLEQRDAAVLAACRRRGLPVAVVLGGGYAADLQDVVTIHANTCALLSACHA
ncbi:MAG TPA: histone deacetylase [Gemmatimonadales bacterium]|nr:histone deacetylase [Gemmatimonadales bacterium]